MDRWGGVALPLDCSFIVCFPNLFDKDPKNSFSLNLTAMDLVNDNNEEEDTEHQEGSCMVLQFQLFGYLATQLCNLQGMLYPCGPQEHPCDPNLSCDLWFGTTALEYQNSTFLHTWGLLHVNPGFLIGWSLLMFGLEITNYYSHLILHAERSLYRQSKMWAF